MHRHLGLVASLPLLLGVISCDDFDRSGRVGRAGNAASASEGEEAEDRPIVVNEGEVGEPAWSSTEAGPSGAADGGPPPASRDSRPAPLSPDGGPSVPPAVSQSACGNAFETEVFELVNQERATAGKAAYKCDPVAGQVARAYSQLMCDLGQFSHEVGGTSPFQRMADAGIKFFTGGENVARGQLTPQQVMQSWMASPGHRSNILGNFAFIGIGYVPCSSSTRRHYWTQDFWK